MEPIPRATRSLPFKINAIPPQYLDSPVVGCWVEVLSLGSLGLDPEVAFQCALLQKLCKNQVVLRFFLKNPTPEFDSFVKGLHIEGVQVSMDILEHPYVQHPEIGSALVLKFLDYSGPSSSSVKSIEVPINGDSVTLGQVLEPAITARLEDFVFVHNGEDYTGCRDWMSQFLRLLEMRGLIYLNTGGESVFESLNYGYIEDGRRFPKKVAKGRFLMHNRVKIEELNYYS